MAAILAEATGATDTRLTELAARLDGRGVRGAPLAELTTLGVGGPADLLFTAESIDDLASAVRAAISGDVPWTLLGDGSNVLISDRGIEGLVIHNCARGLRRDGEGFVVESGLLLSELVEAARDQGLAGLEFAAGIYGTVGGAVCGNAGAYGRAMVDVVNRSEVLTSAGERKRLDNDEHGFTYRTSRIKTERWVVLESTIGLVEGKKQAIGAEIDRILAVRSEKLPANLPSAGSYFKNIEDASAEHGKIPVGKLLEEVGAKSMSEGGASVYEKHANVIVNSGGATAADILRLAERMRVAVRDRFDIALEPEVRFVGRP